MLVAWPRVLYKILQSTEGLVRQVSRSAATQRKRSLLRQQQKRGKTVKFDGTIEEVNIMTAHDATIQRETRRGGQAQNPKSYKYTAVTKEKEHIMVLTA